MTETQALAEKYLALWNEPDADQRRLTVAELTEVLVRSQDLGFLGPGPVARHIEHGRALLAGLPADGHVLDLGVALEPLGQEASNVDAHAGDEHPAAGH